MGECPKIVGSTKIITKYAELLPVTEADTSRSVGVTVNVRCQDGYELNGASQLTCLNTQQWDKAIPTCSVPAPPDEERLNTIIIASCSAASALVLIVLTVILLIYCYKRRQLNREKLGADSEEDYSDNDSIPGKHWQDDFYTRKTPSRLNYKTSSTAGPSERSFHSGVPTRWRAEYGTASPLDSRTIPQEPRYREYDRRDSYRRESSSYRDYASPHFSHGDRYNNRDNKGRHAHEAPRARRERTADHSYHNPGFAPWGRVFSDSEISMTSLPRAHVSAAVHGYKHSSNRPYRDEFETRY